MDSGSRVPRRWTDNEDQVLSREAESQCSQPKTIVSAPVLTSMAVSHGVLKDWNRIAAKLPGRTNKDCRKRWSKIGQNVKKGVWDNAEDERLRIAVRAYGPNWTKVGAGMHTRNADQCAKRWQYSLDPKLDHSEWKIEEDDQLLAAVSLYGRNWKVVKDRKFSGRSTTDIKNRHGIVLRRRRIGSGPTAFDQASSNITPKQHDDQFLIQEPADEDDSGSLTSSFNIFAYENDSLSIAPEAQRSSGSTGSFPDVYQGTVVESLEPFDLNLQHNQGSPSTYIPMTGSGILDLQDDPLNQNSAVVSDAFAIDHEWNYNSIALNPTDVTAASIDMQVTDQMAKGDSDNRTVLTLYNVKPGTLNSMLETVYRSKTKIKMETYY